MHPRFLRFAAAVALALGGLAVPTAGLAAGLTGPIIFHSNGTGADATFLSVDGCIETDVEVHAVVSAQSSEADVLVGQFNTCTSTPLVFAAGSLPNPNFQIDKNLNAASLSNTITVTDKLTGNSFPVVVNVTWAGTGTITHVHQLFQTHTAGFTKIVNIVASVRSAVSSGSVSTLNISLTNAVFGQLFRESIGAIEFAHR